MERQITDLEYSNTDATVEQVKAAIRAAKVIMQRPLPLTHVQLERATCFAYAGDDDRHSHKRRMESVLC